MRRAQGARPSPPQTDAPAARCRSGHPREGLASGAAGCWCRVSAQAACRERRGTTPNGLPTPLVRMGSAPCPAGGKEPGATGASRIGGHERRCQANRAAVDITDSRPPRRCGGRRRSSAPAGRTARGGEGADAGRPAARGRGGTGDAQGPEGPGGARVSGDRLRRARSRAAWSAMEPAGAGPPPAGPGGGGLEWRRGEVHGLEVRAEVDPPAVSPIDPDRCGLPL